MKNKNTSEIQIKYCKIRMYKEFSCDPYAKTSDGSHAFFSAIVMVWLKATIPTAHLFPYTKTDPVLRIFSLFPTSASRQNLTVCFYLDEEIFSPAPRWDVKLAGTVTCWGGINRPSSLIISLPRVMMAYKIHWWECCLVPAFCTVNTAKGVPQTPPAVFGGEMMEVRDLGLPAVQPL